MKNGQQSFLHLLLGVVLVNFLAAQMVHEMGHWAVLQLYGRGPIWGFTGLVQLWGRDPASPDEWVEFTDPNGERGWLHLVSLPSTTAEWVVFLIAGPLAQLAITVVGFMLALNVKRIVLREMGLLLALTNSFSQVMYQIVSMFRGTGGDEFLISFYTGVPRLAVSLLIGSVFAVGLLLGLYEMDGWRTRFKWASALLLCVIPEGPLLAFANEAVINQVDAGNTLFQPVLGFSLPVLVVSGIVFLVLLIVTVKRNKSLGTRDFDHSNAPPYGYAFSSDHNSFINGRSDL